MAVRILILEDILNFLQFFDSPGTYIMIMVFGLVFIPYWARNVHDYIKNPQDYHMVSFEKMFWVGIMVIVFLIVFGFANYIRFLS